MPTRTFHVEELDDLIDYRERYRESRGKGRWSERFDVVFEDDDGRLYHVVVEEGLTKGIQQHITARGTYPESYWDDEDGDEILVDCPEVELYTTLRPVTLFRKVLDVEHAV